MTPPPRVPSLLLRALLPSHAYECVAGDLEEAWRARSRACSAALRLK